METFNSFRLCELSGATYRQVDYWARLGALVPSVVEARGSGTHRCYDLTDALAACVLVDLARLGAQTGVLALVVRALRADPNATGRRLVDPSGNLHSPDSPGTGWLIDLDDARARVEANRSPILVA